MTIATTPGRSTVASPSEGQLRALDSRSVRDQKPSIFALRRRLDSDASGCGSGLFKRDGRAAKSAWRCGDLATQQNNAGGRRSLVAIMPAWSHSARQRLRRPFRRSEVAWCTEAVQMQMIHRRCPNTFSQVEFHLIELCMLPITSTVYK